MKIYVASSWRNPFHAQIIKVLRSLGHEVYDFKNPPHGHGGFAWSDIDPEWEEWSTGMYKKALEHPIAVDGFNSDFEAMQWADCCVMVLPCGRSANTEAGWMKGAGKKVFVYQPIGQEPELMYKIYDGIIENEKQLRNVFTSTNSSVTVTLSEQKQSEIIKWASANAETEKESFSEDRYCGLIDGATHYAQQNVAEIVRLREALEWYADPGNYLGDDGSLATAYKQNENIANKAKEVLKPVK